MIQKCYFCGEEISDATVVCPWCGRRNPHAAKQSSETGERKNGEEQTTSANISANRGASNESPWQTVAGGIFFLVISAVLYGLVTGWETRGESHLLPRILVLLYLLGGKWLLVAAPGCFGALLLLVGIWSLTVYRRKL